MVGSPPDSLPNELLLSIFTECAERSKSAFLDVLAISHTCARWRDIALGYPELWRRYAFSCIPGRDFGALNPTILERCGDITLDVGWYFPVEPPDNWVESATALEKPHADMAKHRHRFRSFTGPSNSLCLSQTGAGPLDGLEELVLVSGVPMHFRTWRILQHNARDALHTTPLRILKLRNCWIPFPWNQNMVQALHTLELHFPHRSYPYFHIDALFDTLRRCGSLKSLSINLKYYTLDPEDLNKEPILLPHLTQLMLVVAPPLLHSIFPRLNAPTLHETRLTVYRISNLDKVAYTRAVISALIKLHLLPKVSPDDNRMRLVKIPGSITIGFSPCPSYLQDTPEEYAEDTTVIELRGRAKIPLTQILSDWLPIAPHLTSLRIPKPVLGQAHGRPPGSLQVSEASTDAFAIDLFLRHAERLIYRGYGVGHGDGKWDERYRYQGQRPLVANGSQFIQMLKTYQSNLLG